MFTGQAALTARTATTRHVLHDSRDNEERRDGYQVAIGIRYGIIGWFIAELLRRMNGDHVTVVLLRAATF